MNTMRTRLPREPDWFTEYGWLIIAAVVGASLVIAIYFGASRS